MNNLINGAALTGIINGSSELVGSIQSAHFLHGVIAVAPTAAPADPYDGEYTVTPRVTEQTLNTKHKYMEDDVCVLAIPYYETSNLSGKTAYIGGE